MSRVYGLILAGGMVLAGAGRADAQISVTLGNPLTGGIAIGQPYGGYGGYGGYGYGGLGGYGYDGLGGYGGSSLYSPLYAPSFGGVTTYSSGYSGYVAPGTTYFNSGYYGSGLGYAPSYGFAPSYGYGRSFGYGYGGLGRGMGGWRGGWSRW